MTPRFFAPEMDPAHATVALSDDESHHARHVLRLRTGDSVTVFDGRGREWSASVQTITARKVVLAIGGARHPRTEPRVLVTLAAAILKGDHMDAVVRDATMLGVAEIVPLMTERVVVPKARMKASLTRWHRVAVASAKQCGRAVVPEIGPAIALAEALQLASASCAVMCVEPTLGTSGTALPSVPPTTAWLFTGPEGGWSSDELVRAQHAGARPLTLGARTLRADAAAIVALSVLWTTWGW